MDKLNSLIFSALWPVATRRGVRILCRGQEKIEKCSNCHSKREEVNNSLL
jgi:cytochrome c2